jgi:hypothetical protein
MRVPLGDAESRKLAVYMGYPMNFEQYFIGQAVA